MTQSVSRMCSLSSVLALVGCLAGPLVARGDVGDDAEHKDMDLVGFNDLQSRSSYQPTVHKYADGRYVAFVGHHPLGTNPVTGAPLPSFNPITGANEPNGTSVVDVTNPRRPRYLAHIPVGTTGNGGAQMVRVCDGASLPARDGKVYMLRSYGNSAHEIWDVTNPASPKDVRTVRNGNPAVGGLSGTHKNWWECDTGIAYIVGRRTTDTAAGWRPGNHIMIYDMGDPANPKFIRDWAMDGQQPGSKLQPHFTNAPSIHGPISTGPVGGALAAFPGVVSGRVYFAYGTGDSGIMQVVDRAKLLASDPADYTGPELGHWVMNPDNGAHTSFPLGNIAVPDFTGWGVANGQPYGDPGNVRDVVFVTSEATSHFCTEPRHVSFLVDVTDEGRPQSVSTAEIPAASGGNSDDRNFCRRGGRFGPHATNENFGPPFYQKLVFVSYFNAGVRAFDVRDPYNPVDVAHYIPAIDPNRTDYRCGTLDGVQNVCRQVIQTNNVDTDDRGYIYIVDRADTGMHILRLTGQAAKIAGLGD